MNVRPAVTVVVVEALLYFRVPPEISRPPENELSPEKVSAAALAIVCTELRVIVVPAIAATVGVPDDAPDERVMPTVMPVALATTNVVLAVEAAEAVVEAAVGAAPRTHVPVPVFPRVRAPVLLSDSVPVMVLSAVLLPCRKNVRALVDETLLLRLTFNALAPVPLWLANKPETPVPPMVTTR